MSPPVTLRDDLHAHAERLRQARRPTDVFGPLDGADLAARLEQLAVAYRKLAADVHPDRYVHSVELSDLATEVFQTLGAWHQLALKQVHANGSSNDQVLQVGSDCYQVLRSLAPGDSCDLYVVRDPTSLAGESLVLKIVRDAQDNDLLDNELETLLFLWSRPQQQLEVFGRYLPRVRGTLRLDDGRRANLLSLAEDYVSLAEVQLAYPKGVDGRSLAWIGNRLFEFMAWLHRQGVIHAAVLPDHVLIHPVTHGAMLVDWCCAVRQWQYPAGPHVRAVPSPHKKRYPKEVFSRAAASPRLDLYLAASTLAQTAGVDLWTFKRPVDLGDPQRMPIPEVMNEILRGCHLERLQDRFADAFEVLERWKMAQRRAFGPRKFHPFVMPTV